MKRLVRVGQALILTTSILALLASFSMLVIFVVFDGEVERYTAGKMPAQFYEQLIGDELDDYQGVFGVAHNSGDSISATREAVEHGADIIEIDVITTRGRLFAGHDRPLPLVGGQLFRGPSLARAWTAAAEADAIKLDLKVSSQGFVDRVVRFLEARPGPDVVVSSDDAATLAAFRDRVPDAVRLLRVTAASDIERLRTDAALLALIDGVTVRHTLLDDETLAWFEEQRLLVFAWTVNDLERLNHLVAGGVDAVTTDNLAILQLLGGQERDERAIRRR